MAAVLAQGATFSFNGTAYTALSIRVERSTPELVNMSGTGDGAGKMVMVPSGDFQSPGSITVEALGASAPALGSRGQVSIGGSLAGFSFNAICTGISVEARVGDLVRSVITFTPTDYYG